MDDAALFGGLQDDISALRYALAKSCENSEEFADCLTPFAIYCRLIDLGKRSELESVLADSLRRLNANFKDAPRWVGQLVELVERQDVDEFNKLYLRATNAAVFGK